LCTDTPLSLKRMSQQGRGLENKVLNMGSFFDEIFKK
jgi:hypothetical protein